MSQLKALFRVRIFFVRHGESQMNISAHLLGGQHNHVPLTQKGINQATLLGQRLAFDHIKFDHVYTSTAVRAKQTAEIALKEAGLTPTISDSDALLEQAQGEWEGKHRKDVYTEQVHQDMLDKHLDFFAPGGESLRDVQKRAMKFMNTEVEKWCKVSEEGSREIVLGVFGHGGCIRTMLNSYCGIHDRWTWLVTQDNTAMNEILIDARGTATIRINDTAHLRYTMVTPTLMQRIEVDQPADAVPSAMPIASQVRPHSPKRPTSPGSPKK